MESICALKEVYKALYQFEKSFAEEYDLTINEAMLLCCLKDGSAKTVGSICDYIGLSLPRISKIVTAMEKKQYVHRSIDKDDHRKMLYKLSTKGKQKVECMQETHVNMKSLCENMNKFIENEQLELLKVE